MVNLGTIEQVDLREVWPHEAQDFTPWLADNLDKLGEALGLDLELQSAEAAVGSFSLDVLAHDLGSNRPVIIENQLEVTNHDHLGKLLTYAAGYDAYAVVWLTREFRDEHRQALDWLNQRTDEETQFFGVVVEAWKIDDSRPAPHFRLMAFPNDWQKHTATATRGIRSENVSETRERYREFFQSLTDTMRDEHGFTNARTVRGKNYASYGSGFPRIRYAAVFRRGGNAGIEIWDDKRKLHHLFNQKESLELALGEPLNWDNNIASYRDGSIDDDPETLEEIQDWMVDRLLAFKRVFTPHLQELVG